MDRGYFVRITTAAQWASEPPNSAGRAAAPVQISSPAIYGRRDWSDADAGHVRRTLRRPSPPWTAASIARTSSSVSSAELPRRESPAVLHAQAHEQRRTPVRHVHDLPDTP
ncbi:hypothetical protein [Candidatus Palauibacter sp.]|uniref:hypothetical protein n=1 Tax=Candidatus Palauibacter sp. TaxID=3101350 RepID=UPI003B51687E